jgi:glycosyltransferase involved in cell wall biosynthesis
MMRTRKIAVITTHPIQYNAPLFKLIAQRNKVSVKVFYTWGESVLEAKYDPGFKKQITWDIPLLEGYEYEFLENTAVDKGSHHFKGIDNPNIIAALRAYAPDAILLFGWSYKSHLKVMRHFHKKVPILFRGDSTLLNDVTGSYKSLLRKYFLRWVYKNVDYAFHVGKNNFDYYKQAGLRDEQLIYAPHAIDNDRFERTSDSISQAALFRQQLGIDKNAVVFLYAGKLEAVKDPILLLNAFLESQLNKNAHLVFVGNGHLEQELKEKAKGIAGVHFMEFQNQSKMPAVYQMADVYILASWSETWGLALNEAMVGGSIVIASDKCGGAIDLIEDGKNGFVFKAGSKEELIAKMKAIKPELLNTMKQASIQKIKAFNFTAISEAIESTVLSLSTSKMPS